MKNILLATDFSPNARNAIEYTFDLFGYEDVNYILLNTYIEPHATTDVIVSLNDFLKKESIDGLNKENEYFLQNFGQGKLNIKVISKYGDLTWVINKLANTNHFDFVVLGSKGASAFEYLFMGSNAINVVKSVKIPLLVIPDKMKFSSLRRIGFAADYLHLDSVEVLDPLANIARKNQSKLMIVHVHSESDDTNYKQALEGSELHGEFHDIQHQFYGEKNSNIVEGIEHFIKEHKVELLTMVARKHHFFERLFQKSITKEISKFADIPLLVLHE
ncbi:MAG: universal stress protein [Crocinitomicaceae bacterium]|nr:universal stress protein [Crocinitomicaceae bacterium]